MKKHDKPLHDCYKKKYSFTPPNSPRQYHRGALVGIVKIEDLEEEDSEEEDSEEEDSEEEE